jgi:hypothetical protein
VLFTKHCERDQIKENEIFESCSKHRDEKCIAIVFRNLEKGGHFVDLEVDGRR